MRVSDLLCCSLSLGLVHGSSVTQRSQKASPQIYQNVPQPRPRISKQRPPISGIYESMEIQFSSSKPSYENVSPVSVNAEDVNCGESGQKIQLATSDGLPSTSRRQRNVYENVSITPSGKLKPTIPRPGKPARQAKSNPQKKLDTKPTETVFRETDTKTSCMEKNTSKTSDVSSGCENVAETVSSAEMSCTSQQSADIGSLNSSSSKTTTLNSGAVNLSPSVSGSPTSSKMAQNVDMGKASKITSKCSTIICDDNSDSSKTTCPDVRTCATELTQDATCNGSMKRTGEKVDSEKRHSATTLESQQPGEASSSSLPSEMVVQGVTVKLRHKEKKPLVTSKDGDGASPLDESAEWAKVSSAISYIPLCQEVDTIWYMLNFERAYFNKTFAKL